MIKCIFFDIDGTLLSFKTHQVSPGTIQAFDRLHRSGIRTFISSGRPQSLLPSFPVSFDGYILMNGGYCFVGDKVLVRNPIHPQDREAWLNHVRQRGKVTMAFSDKEMFLSGMNDTCREIDRQMGIPEPPFCSLEKMRDMEVFQFIAIQGADEDQEVLNMLPHSRLPRWHNLFSDLIPKESSKAVGIDHIIRHLGISRDEAMAFGDGNNDIEMLDFVGLGVAMGNAAETVKNHADYVTTTVDEEGILTALENLKII